MKHIVPSVLPLAVLAFALSAAAGEATFPNPLSDAKTGEWALYSIPGGYTQKLTVVARDGDGPDANVRIKVEYIYNGNVASTQELIEVAGDAMGSMSAPEAGATQQIVEGIVTVKDAAIPVTTMITRENDGSEVTYSVSPAVPVYGLVRQTADGQVEIQLLDHGTQ